MEREGEEKAKAEEEKTMGKEDDAKKTKNEGSKRREWKEKSAGNRRDKK